jgi:hypothetical protein
MSALGTTVDDAVRAIIREEVGRVLRAELRLVISELQSATPAPKEFLSVPEGAKLLDVSETTVRMDVERFEALPAGARATTAAL